MYSVDDFNIGDQVVIREWDDMEEEYGVNSAMHINCQGYFTNDMRGLCGRMFTIQNIRKNGIVYFEECDDWYFSVDMIKPLCKLDCANNEIVDDFIL